MNATTGKLLGQLLISLDDRLSFLDRKVFEAAHIPSCWDGLDAQRDRACDPNFLPPIKIKRDQLLEQRNALAQLLGFGCREAHSLHWQDYKLTNEGLVAA